MQTHRKPAHAGIAVRHSRSCDSRVGGECACKPTYQAHVWSARERKRIRKTFPTFAAAKAWRHDASVALRKGTMKAPTRITLKQAAEVWIVGARDGSIRNRSGDPYKPSAIRGYEQALRLRVLPDLGARRLSELGRNDFQDLVDRLVAKGADPSTVRNTLMPVRAIFRRAMARGDVATNPTTGLELPAVRGVRERIATPDEAVALIDAVPIGDGAIWATSMYAGLRLGELMALDWSAVDFEAGVIRVERSWDPKEGLIEPKSRAGRRVAPIPSGLRGLLREHRLRQGRAGKGLVFGRSETRPFNPSSVQRRARAAWTATDLTPITPHECRHTFASMMIAAGVNAKALSTYMGHANIAITMDRYGHLMPGNEQEAAGLLDAYLDGAASLGSASS
jgi:integrase